MRLKDKVDTGIGLSVVAGLRLKNSFLLYEEEKEKKNFLFSQLFRNFG